MKVPTGTPLTTFAGSLPTGKFYFPVVQQCGDADRKVRAGT